MTDFLYNALGSSEAKKIKEESVGFFRKMQKELTESNIGKKTVCDTQGVS